jgi:hypothetical protein
VDPTMVEAWRRMRWWGDVRVVGEMIIAKVRI